MTRLFLLILLGIGGLYLGSWAGIAHESDWWSYPTLIFGLIMAAGGIVGLVGIAIERVI